jgi:hypothetical protein
MLHDHGLNAVRYFGSGSALDPHSIGFWIRIQMGENLSPKKEEKLSQKTRKNMTISIFYAVLF